jgi:hypothetical protein
MTDNSRDGAEGPIKPQVIDLQAEEVVAETPEAAEPPSEEAPQEAVPPSPPPKPASRKRGNAAWILAALAIGAVAGGWFYRELLSSYLPSDAMLALQARVDTLEARTATLNSQLTAVSQATDGAAQKAEALDSAIAQTAAEAKAAQETAGSLENRITSVETAIGTAKSDLEALRAAMSSGASTGTIDSAALAAIVQRIEALEKDVASLKGGSGVSDSSSAAAALSQALSDLKAKIAAGASYQTELDRIARMVPAAEGLDVLSAHAGAGLPDAKGLAQELRAIVPQLPRPVAEQDSGDGGYLDSAWDLLSSVVKIRTIGETDWQSVAAQSADFAENGELRQAIGLIDAAEGAKPPLLGQWRERAAQRLRLEAALDQASAAVLRQIAALGGGQ